MEPAIGVGPVEPRSAGNVFSLSPSHLLLSQIVHFPTPPPVARRHRFVQPMGNLPFEGPQRAEIRHTERSALSRWRGEGITFRRLPEVP